MISLLFTTALVFATVPQWSFVPEQPGIPYLHVQHNGVDLGRSAPGTYYAFTGDEATSMHFVSDSIFRGGFQ